MWNSLVINLAANTARMKNSSAALIARGIPFERLDAVDGRNISDDDIEKVYDANSNRRHARHPLVRPEIGCYLSHIAAWRRIAEGAALGGFIFEDDFEAGNDLAVVLEQLTTDDVGDWDMVKLFSLDRSPRILRRRSLGPKHELAIPYRVPTCLIGYALTRQAAQQLVQRAIPFFRPVDEDQKFFWETGLRVGLVLPPPIRIGDQQSVTGTIGTARRDAEDPRGPVLRAIHGAAYQLNYRARLHWHRSFGRGS